MYDIPNAVSILKRNFSWRSILIFTLGLSCSLLAGLFYCGSLGRANAYLHGDIVYTPDTPIQLGDRKHGEIAEINVRLENLTNEVIRLEGMNPFGQINFMNDAVAAQISPGGTLILPFKLKVFTVKNNPNYKTTILIYVSCEKYGRQEVAVFIKANVIDASQIDPSSCQGCGK